MAVPLAESIVSAVREGLSAWKTFIATRQEAYNRKQDKRQERAINIAEQTYEKVSELFEFLTTIPLENKAENTIKKHKIVIYKLKAKFNKYD
jgi:hypothetical protein